MNFDFSIQNLEFRKNPIENVSINGSILVIFGEKMMSKKTSNLEVGLADRETETKRGKKTKTEKQRHKNTKIRNRSHP